VLLFGKDMRSGLRALLRRPGLTTGIIAILGVAIGAMVTVFSLVDSFLLRPLPYPEADRLVWIRSVHAGKSLGVSYADHLDWKKARAFEGMALFNADEYSVLSHAGTAESVLTTRTTSELFSVLRVRPFLGRLLSTAEDVPGSANAVLVSHTLWRGRFGADPGMIGRSVTVDGAPYTVIGVLPPGFHFPVRSDLWIPSSAWADQWDSRNIRVNTVVGRLRPGATVAEARTEMEAISERLERDYPDTNSGIRGEFWPLREVWTRTSRAGLLLLILACGMLLLIACGNVAHLLLVWAGTRERDTAVQIALGIQPSQTIRQAAVEVGILGLASGAVGLLLAFLGVRLVAWLLPGQLPSWVDIRVDARSATFALALSLCVGLLTALAPALHSLTVQPRMLLQNDHKNSGVSRRKGRGSHSLAVAEVALSFLLLSCTGLFLKSLTHLQRVDPGFQPEGALALEVHLPVFRLGSYREVVDLYQRILERVGALPGVMAVGVTTDLPFGGKETRKLWELGIEGQSPEERRRNPRAHGHVVSADYFRALGMPLLRGRFFQPSDAKRETQGVICSRSFAERFWPGRQALGQRLSLGPPGSTSPPLTVVGVVESVHHESLTDSLEGLDLYVLIDRLPSWPIHLVVRIPGDPMALAATVRREIRNVSQELGMRDLAPLASVVTRSLWQERIWATLFSVFSGIALLLAAAGVYGTISHRVSQRSREIAIRLALGAEHHNVLRTILNEVAGISALGIGLGLAGALTAGRLLAAMLYQVQANDPVVLALAAATLTLISFAACVVPLRRALGVDPAVVLRWE